MTEFLTLDEAKGKLRIRSRKTILKYIKSGQLAAVKIGGTRWRISSNDLDHFIHQHKQGGPS